MFVCSVDSSAAEKWGYLKSATHRGFCLQTSPPAPAETSQAAVGLAGFCFSPSKTSAVESIG